MVGGGTSSKPLGQDSQQEIHVRVVVVVWSLKSRDEASRLETQTQADIEALSQQSVGRLETQADFCVELLRKNSFFFGKTLLS